MSEPLKLYHYTSQAGLLGIIQSGGVWATNCLFLNDSAEFLYAANYAKEVVARMYFHDDYRGPFAWALRTCLEQCTAENIYVASFSASPDLLSQWRGYCPNGAGFCLGFSTNKLAQFSARNGYRLAKCIYDEEILKSHISGLVKDCEKIFPPHPVSREVYDGMFTAGQADLDQDYSIAVNEGKDKQKAQEAINFFLKNIMFLAPLFKHGGFSEEAEWRLIITSPQGPLKFRPGSSYLCPYIELPILSGEFSNSLKEVIVGPNPNQSRSDLSLRMLLQSKDQHDVEVTTSRLPFNNW